MSVKHDTEPFINLEVRGIYKTISSLFIVTSHDAVEVFTFDCEWVSILWPCNINTSLNTKLCIYSMVFSSKFGVT